MLGWFIHNLHLLTVLAGGHRTPALENLALRQQLAMYKRTRRRPATRCSDRLFWLGLRRVWSDWSGALVILRPATVIGWHRRGFAWYWSRQSRAIGGRPRLGQELRRLVRDMANANPLWGAPRIHGELMKLGLAVSERTISRLMPRRRRPPSQTWRTFLQNHVGSLVAIDFFTVPTITGRLLVVLVVLAHAVGASCTSMSRRRPRRRGHASSSAKPFPGRWLRDLCCTTAIRSSTPRSAALSRA